MQCPNCESDNVQRLSVAYKSGLSTSENTTSGVGIGFSGGGFGAGVGAAKNARCPSTKHNCLLIPVHQLNSISWRLYLFTSNGGLLRHLLLAYYSVYRI